jgi:hypothetical protein
MGRWGPFLIEIDSDGETFLGFDDSGVVHEIPRNLDMGLPPVAICFDLSTQIKTLTSRR